MNLYELTLAAEYEVSTYRSASLDDWIKQIDPVLEAAGEYQIGSDKVESLTVMHDEVSIYTSYYVRGKCQTNEICLPTSIIKAEFPVKAATLYRINKELKDAKLRLATTQRLLAQQAEKVAALETELLEFTENQEEQ